MRDLLLLDGVCEGGSISQCLIFIVTTYSSSAALLAGHVEPAGLAESQVEVSLVGPPILVGLLVLLIRERELGHDAVERVAVLEQIGTGWDAQQEWAKSIRDWYSKCPFRLRVDLGNTCENPGYGELTDMCATVTVDATKIVHRTDHRRGCSDDYGPGVASRRLDLNVPEETSRQLATVIAALRIRTTRPPGWLRITIDNMEK